MKITFLGTGTSHGVPVLGCSCPVCKSTDEHDKRYRSSLVLEKDGKVLIIDTGYEFRLAALRAGLTNVDGVLYTHSHADHIAGIDDLRVFSQKQQLCVYANASTIDYINTHYAYAVKKPDFPGIPHLTPVVLSPYEKIMIQGFEVTAIPIEHGRITHMGILGFRIGDFAYLTDCTFIPEESFAALKGVKTLVMGALRKEPHGAHFSFSESYAAFKRIGAEKLYFTHINHSTSYEEINTLYDDAKSAYDGLSICI